MITQQRNALLLFLMLVPVWAGAVPMACQPGSYQSYVDLGGDGCTSGQLTLASFKFLGPDLTADAVQVTPAPGALTFDINMMVASMDGAEKSVGFEFVVTAMNGIGGVSLSFVGAAVDPDATATVTKAFDGGPLNTFEMTDGANVTTSKKSDSVGLPGLPLTLKVTDTATVSTKPAGNIRAASINSLTNGFAVVPEPGSAALLLVATAVLPQLRRRRAYASRRDVNAR